MANLSLDLFRACKRNRRSEANLQQGFEDINGAGYLYPDYQGFKRKDGSIRLPDVSTFDCGGVTWVRGVRDVDTRTGKAYVSASQGVSLNKSPGKFGYQLWYYFLLPEGTELPVSLDVVQTGSDSNHYSLRCVNSMTKDAYEGALDNVARAAIAKAVELGRSPLSFS